MTARMLGSTGTTTYDRHQQDASDERGTRLHSARSVRSVKRTEGRTWLREQV